MRLRGVPCITVRGKWQADRIGVGKSQTDRLQSGAINGQAKERDLRHYSRPRFIDLHVFYE